MFDMEMYNELVQGILHVMPEQIHRIVLYGSTARGTAEMDSDIDIAIFITHRLDGAQEDTLSDFVVDMNLKYNKIFSVIDIDQKTYMKWRDVAPFYQNVDREGVVLWKAA